MKKKIINGFLMVALLAATVTSFVSCKDNNEDVKTDLLAQINLQKCTCNQAWIAADQALLTTINAQLANKANDSEFQTLKTYVESLVIPTVPDISDLVNNTTFNNKITELNNTIGTLAEQGFVEHQVDSLWNALNDLNDPASIASKMKDVNDKLADQSEDIEDIQENLGNIENKLEKLQDQIDAIVYALTNMVTSVTINATANSILSNSKVFPGLDMQIVGAAYGEPINAQGDFPSKECGLSEDALAGVKDLKGFYHWEGNQLITNEDDNGFNAGKIYFTLNPSNIDPNNLKSLTLVNSQNKQIFELGDVTKSSEVLTWGITRGEAEPTLWEAPVKYDAESVKALNLKEIINFNALKNNVKNIINEAKNVDSKSSAKSAAKTVLKETAGAVATLLNSKIPAMQAVALKATWEDTVGVRSVLSDYSIAATAYKPLSFSEFNGVSLGTDINFTKVDNGFKKILDKVRNELNGIDLSGLKIGTITMSEDDYKNYDKSQYIWIKIYTRFAYIFDIYDKAITDINVEIATTKSNTEVPAGFVNDWDGWYYNGNEYYGYQTTISGPTKIDADMKAAIQSLIEGKVNGTLTSTNNAIQDVVDQVKNVIKKANEGLDKVESLENSVTDYLESFINRTINFVSTGRFLEPILLVNSNDGIRRATGTYEAGKYTFVPTTMNYELIAPAFKKYIAVLDKNGKVIAGSQKILTKGDKDFSAVEVNLTTDAAQIVYAAMDFRGYQVAKVYNVTVK